MSAGVNDVCRVAALLWPPASAFSSYRVTFSWPSTPSPTAVIPSVPLSGGGCTATVARYNDQGGKIADGTATVTSPQFNFNTLLPQEQRWVDAQNRALDSLMSTLVSMLPASALPFRMA